MQTFNLTEELTQIKVKDSANKVVKSTSPQFLKHLVVHIGNMTDKQFKNLSFPVQCWHMQSVDKINASQTSGNRTAGPLGIKRYDPSKYDLSPSDLQSAAVGPFVFRVKTKKGGDFRGHVVEVNVEQDYVAMEADGKAKQFKQKDIASINLVEQPSIEDAAAAEAGRHTLKSQATVKKTAATAKTATKVAKKAGGRKKKSASVVMKELILMHPKARKATIVKLMKKKNLTLSDSGADSLYTDFRSFIRICQEQGINVLKLDINLEPKVATK